MVKTIKINEQEFKIKNDAYVLVIYQQLTNTDLNKFGSGNISFKTLIDILFAFCFNADNTIEY